MKLTYAPTDGDTQEWAFDLDDLTVGETKALERALNLTWFEIGDQFDKGSVSVTFAFLWIFRRRDEPKLRIDDMDQIPWSQLKMTDDEAPEGDQAAVPKDSPGQG